MAKHWQNATWEPAIVVNQGVPNSYWIMQENGAEQPKVYRCTRTMFKIDLLPLMVNKKPKSENSQQKQIMLSFTSQLSLWEQKCHG